MKLNITLPAETVSLIEEMGVNNRSAFINQAVRTYIARQQRSGLKRKLKEAYLAGANEDRALAAEWDYVGVEALALLDADEAMYS